MGQEAMGIMLCHLPTVFCRHPDVTLESGLVLHTTEDLS